MFGISKAKKYVDRNSWKTPKGVTAKDITMFIIEELEQLAELDTSLNIRQKL